MTSTQPWRNRFWAIAVCLTLAAGLVGGARVAAQTSVSIETCEDWAGTAPVRCGPSFPQGAPWLTYVFRGVPAGRYVIQRTSANFTGTPAIVAVTGPVAHFALTGTRRALPPAEAYTVTLRDQVSGRVVAQGTYTLTPQTPQEALAVWGSGAGAYQAMGAALAAWRLGDTQKALTLAHNVTAAGRWSIGLAFAYSFIYEISMMARDYPAAIEAVQSLMQARRAAAAAGQDMVPAQPVEYEWLVRAQVAACRLDAARATLTEGLQAFPNNRGLVALTNVVEGARSKCP